MRIRTLGGLGLEGTTFTRPKPLLLLAFLAVEGAQPRRRVAGLFWPEARDGMKSQTVALTHIRRGAPGAIETDGRRVWTHVPSDVGEFRTLLEHGRQAEAAALYAGPFLDGFDGVPLGVELEEWLYGTREAIALQVQRTLLGLAVDEAARHRFDRAAHRAEPAVGLAPGVAEPEDLARLHTVLLAGRSPLAAVVRAEATAYDLPLPASAEEARSRLLGSAPAVRPLPPSDAPLPPADAPVPSDDVPLAPGDAPVPPVDLPRWRTAFIGRRHERHNVGCALTRSGCRLLSLVGPPGVGKSRLALQAAQELHRAGAFAAVRFVRFGAAGSVAEMPATIVEALGFGPTAPHTPLAATAAVIGRRRWLLVCDMDEPLTGVAEGVGHLLDRCPNLTLLAASRERLHLDGERVFRVGGLGYPATVDVGPEEAMRSDAVRLFVRRARRVRPDYLLDPAEVSHVVRLCRAVDGHPLGLELAAAWIRVMPTGEIADAVADGIDLLDTPTRDVPERHRSVRVAFERWWRALPAPERRLLVRLTPLHDGFGREAAGAVAGATLRALASLVDASWLRVDAAGRYTRHPLVHHFTRAKAAAAPAETTDAARRHARYFLAQGRRARDLWIAGRRHAAVGLVEEARNDLEAALGRLDPGDDLAGLGAAVEALRMYFEVRSRCAEGVVVMARLRARGAGGGHGRHALIRRFVAAEARLCRCGGGREGRRGPRAPHIGASAAAHRASAGRRVA